MLASLALLLSLAGTVVAVHDGDTVTVLDASRQQTRVRVEGIDCPELHQAFGRKAKRFTSEVVYGKHVKVEGSKRDQYGRLIGRVLVNGRDLSLELARAGLAWHFVRYSSDKALAIASNGGDLPLERAHHVAELGALLPWRETQGVYVFDETLAPILDSTPLERDVPTEALHHLPEWCLYMALDGEALGVPGLVGSFVHLDHHMADPDLGVHERTELRLLLDLDASDGPGLLSIPIHLGHDLHDGIRAFLEEGAHQAERIGHPGLDRPSEVIESIRRVALPILTRALYLCAEEADILDGNRRPHPRLRAVSSRRPKEPLVWDVGARLGPALTLALSRPSSTDVPTTGTHASPRPHVRRAHWHHFRTGPRDGPQHLTLRWLPPIPVNLDIGSIVPTVRRVQ